MKGGEGPQILPAGDAALVVEFGQAEDPALNARVRALDQALEGDPPPGFLEAVPTHRSLLVLYDAERTDFSELGRRLRKRTPSVGVPPAPGRARTVPTLYGGESGPDLPAVARACGLSEEEAIALHASLDYTCFMLGFAPGFAYLGLLPEALAMPRRATPRVRVPAGSVAIAGRQTGIYPRATAGGWSLLGRTSLLLFDPGAEPPALILPGDRVRFVPVPELAEEPVPEAREGRVAEPAFEVLDGGLLTTVQDLGRTGYRRLGVARAGALDEPALRAANRRLGNPDGAAALECTVGGPTLRFLRATAFAITGADLAPVLQRQDLGAWPVPAGSRVQARAGNVLSFGPRRSGCRAYVAFAGGIDVPLVLGSRATDLSGGFGGLAGRPLRARDAIGLGPSRSLDPAAASDLATNATPATSGAFTLRVVLGPQDDHFTEEALHRLLSEPYLVGAASDRVGCRLEGPALPHRGASEIVSDGMVAGSVQVPPDGRPIVMLAEGPTTGGYPKIATVVGADLPLLAQAVPGEAEVRFAAVAANGARLRPRPERP